VFLANRIFSLLFMKEEFFRLLQKDMSVVDFIQQGADVGFTIKKLDAEQVEWSSAAFWDVFGIGEPDKSQHAQLRKQRILAEDYEKENRLIKEKDTYSYILKVKKSEQEVFSLGCSFKKIGDYAIIKYARIGTNLSLLFGQKFTDFSKDLVAIINEKFQFEYVNQELDKTLGYDAGQLIGKSIEQFLHEEDKLQHIAAWEDLFSSPSEPRNTISRVKKRDGDFIWLEWRAVANADFNAAFFVAKDITEAKQKEALQKSLNKSLLSLSNLPGLIDNNFTDFIKHLVIEVAKKLKVDRFSFWRFLDKEEGIQLEFLYDGRFNFIENGTIFKKNDYPNYFNAIINNRELAVVNAAENKKTQDFAGNYLDEFKIKSLLDVQVFVGDKCIGVLCAETRKKRAWKYEECNYLSSIAEIFSTTYAVSEKREIEKKLKDSQALYKSLVNAMPHFIYRTDLDGRVTFANDAILQDLGMSRDEIVGKIGYDLFPEELSIKYKKDDQYIIENNAVFRDTELHFFKGEDKVKYVEVVKLPVLDANGNMEGIQGIYWDVTEYKSKEISKNKLLEKLKRQNEELTAVRNRLEFINKFSTNVLTQNTLEEIAEVLVNSACYDYSLSHSLVFVKHFSRDTYEKIAEASEPSNKIKSRAFVDDIQDFISNSLDTVEVYSAEASEIFEKNNVELGSDWKWIFIPLKIDVRSVGVLVVGCEESIDEQGLIEKLEALCRIVAMRIQNSIGEIKQKETDTKLRKNEELYKSIIDAVGEGIVVQDSDDEIKVTNKSASRILGLTENQLLGRDSFDPLWQSTHADGTPLLPEQHPSMVTIKTGKPVDNFMMCVNTGKGEKKYISVNTRPVKDQHGHMYGSVASFSDITAKVIAEKEVKRLAHVAEKSGEIILTCNASGKIFWVNAAIADVLGYNPEEVIGKEPGNIIKSDNSDKLTISDLATALQKHLNFTATLGGTKKDSSLCWISYEVTPIFDNNNKFLYSIVVMKDDTELIKRQKELERLLKSTVDQNERLREYSYITSHNIRSSVANIIALSDLLLQDPNEVSYVELINKTIHKLDLTIKNINQLLNLEESLDEKDMIPCQLLETIKRTLSLHNELIKQKGANIKVHVPAQLHVRAIPAYLDSIFYNLVTNALKYGITELSKQIEIKAFRLGDRVTVQVKDYGLGIDTLKFKEKLFKLGSRFHEQISDGQGMGLFITKRQVENLGGNIEVESKKGLHTIFKVTLRVHE